MTLTKEEIKVAADAARKYPPGFGRRWFVTPTPNDTLWMSDEKAAKWITDGKADKL